jgi:hypothetical protein
VSRLDQTHRDPVFDAQPTATLVLDTDLRIRAVNRAYEAAVQRSADDLLGSPLFDAFPDNPTDADADGVRNLGASLESVARRGRPHDMLVQRYDIADPVTGEWVTRVWRPVNLPVLDGDRVVGLLHQTTDITPSPAGLRSVLSHYRALLQANGDTAGAADLLEFTDQVATMLARQEDLVGEVLHLRKALTARATIDQAKGIIMAERRCTAEEAFALLRELSNHSQVKLADVALAFVYRAQRSDDMGRSA